MVHKCAYSEFHFAAIKMAVFVAKTNKMSLLSKKSAVFMAGVRLICYICTM